MGKVSNQFQILGTPNKNEEAFYIDLDQETLSKFRSGDFPRTSDGGNTATVYEDWKYALPERVKQGWGDYIYTSKQEIGDGGLRFFWGLNKTEEEKNTPYQRVWKKHGNHRWPPILKSLYLLEDYNFPRSTNRVTRAGGSGVVIAPTYYDRVVYIPDTNEGTRFLVEEFLAATPFVIPRYQTPVATGVQYSINGLQGSFPECLHDDIEIPSTTTASIAYQSGSAAAAGGSLEGQFFPRTNFKNWRPYVVFDEQEEVPTGWSRMRIRVYPPMRPRAIRR
jgi:hypothetical protein